MVAGLAIGFILMHLIVVRPMRRQMEGLRSDVAAVHGEMQELVGARDDVWKTNNLLTDLRKQQWLVDDARKSLQTIKQFGIAVNASSDISRQTIAAIDELRQVQESLVGQRDLTDPASQALDELFSLQDRLIDQQITSFEAENALDQLLSLKHQMLSEALDAEIAETSLDRLTDLKARVMTESDHIDAARRGLNQLASLKNNIIQESDDLDTAQRATDELLSLKERIAIRGGGTNSASQNVDRLIALRDGLIGDNMAGIFAAASNAEKLIKLKSRINAGSYGVVAARTTARQMTELLDDVANSSVDVDTARKNIERLTVLHDGLSSEELDFTTAGYNLERFLQLTSSRPEHNVATVRARKPMELLAERASRFEMPSVSLNGLSGDVLTIVVGQSVVGRAVQAIAPLVRIAGASRKNGQTSSDPIAVQAKPRNSTTRMSRRLPPFNHPRYYDVVEPGAHTIDDFSRDMPIDNAIVPWIPDED